MPARRRSLAPLSAFALLVGAIATPVAPTQQAHADLASLVTNDSFFNPLEKRAAIANQNTFNTLDPVCANGAGSRCTAQQFKVYENVRELVHTANELQGTGPTAFSLQLDRQGLGFALRWTSAEETSAQGSTSSEFSNGQISNLASRMTALRFGARGFQLTGTGLIPDDQMAILARAAEGHGLGNGLRGGAAGDDANGEKTQFSQLGGFLNFSYGWGDRSPTQVEDAFNYDAYEFTGGLDYRFDNGLVIGITGGGVYNRVDFNSVKSIVDGGIDGNGFSGSVFAMYSPSAWYVSALGSFQYVHFKMTRFIRYPSFNPDEADVNTATLSETNSRTYTAELATGYNLNWTDFALEPYVKADFVRTQIDAFKETDITNAGFEFDVGEQTIDSSEVTAGVRATYVWTPSFGVFMPYAKVEAVHDFKSDARKISTVYRSLGGMGDAKQLDFKTPTDKVDPDYFNASVGLSAIVRGGRPDDNGVIHGGVQVFVEYRRVFALKDITDNVVSAGLRYEF